MRRILVTGGCGFIGSNLIRLLRAERPDAEVVNLDALTYAGNPENLADLAGDPGYRFVHGSVTDPEKVAEAMAGGVDAVLHLAAESHVDRSLYRPDAFISTNVGGTGVLLRAALEFGAPRFVMVSTDEVYGSLGPAGLFTETSPLAPSSPYSATKASADLLALAFHRTFGLPVVVTRASNNYGPYQFPEKMIPLFLSNALEDRPLPVYGDGRQVRDWIHVGDHARGLLAALDRGRPGEVYNLGGGNEIENLDLTRRLLRRLGKPESLITYVKDRPGHDRRYALDIAKARRELGWSPLVPFDDGLARTADWYRENRGWWERIKSGAYREFYEKHYGAGARG